MNTKDTVQRILLTGLLIAVVTGQGSAVTSKITRHTSSSDLQQGKVKDAVVTSKGTIKLGRAAEIIAEEQFKDVWPINSIVASAGIEGIILQDAWPSSVACECRHKCAADRGIVLSHSKHDRCVVRPDIQVILCDSSPSTCDFHNLWPTGLLARAEHHACE